MRLEQRHSELRIGGQGRRARQLVEETPLRCAQFRPVEHAEVAHLADVLRPRLRCRLEQEIGDHHGAFLVGRVVRNRDEAGVADGAFGKYGGAHRRRKQSIDDGDGRFGWIEGDHQIDLAVVQQLALRRPVFRKLASLSPEQRTQRVVPRPQRRGGRHEVRIRNGALQYSSVGCQLV
jgi:hypothetical protein